MLRRDPIGSTTAAPVERRLGILRLGILRLGILPQILSATKKATASARCRSGGLRIKPLADCDGRVAARRARVGRATHEPMGDPGKRKRVGTSVGIPGERFVKSHSICQDIGCLRPHACERIPRFRGPGSIMGSQIPHPSLIFYLTESSFACFRTRHRGFSVADLLSRIF